MDPHNSPPPPQKSCVPVVSPSSDVLEACAHLTPHFVPGLKIVQDILHEFET